METTWATTLSNVYFFMNEILLIAIGRGDHSKDTNMALELLLITTIIGGSLAACPTAGVVAAGSKNYYLKTVTESWNNARQKCKNEGNFLAVWETREEFDAAHGLGGG